MPGDCRLIQFDVIAEATNHFSESNIIGKGGYGVVYKGVFADGQGIAVKTLICLSRHGIQGFRNEVALISRVQHNNLVRLLGYCDNEDHKILVYEFLENSSLNKYIFDSARSPIILEWEDRLKIINGIARGLLYLHQDSRYRIIHLDLKPDNVLLGKDLVPKISDFGMAETLRNNETEANATTTAGTFGYMAPEYQSHGIFSAKSDVFSYGVMILEIVSGKKNRDYPKQNDGDQLLSVIWNNWSQGKGLEIVDSVIMNSPFGSKTELQIIRCIQIGLLCVQVDAEDRPTMSSVVLMLGTETVEIGQPKSPVETASSSSSSRQGQEFESSTINQITVSVFDAR
ncbi:unnamed protein product [Microthlaspi erraticum]|uniref:non-specific serine/threonine protein kinase n=1 Tax=Microthlaspi erraticum TaxID=1685480 RepID=A0A6D2HSN3_9BRAS|nr:unnamed protein product [Microthlaspi erraticum]